MIDDLYQKSFWNPYISNHFPMSYLYLCLTERKENSRTSSFEEGAPDVAQNQAQELVLDKAEATHFRGPI